MLARRATRPLCSSCRSNLLDLFLYGLIGAPKPRHAPRALPFAANPFRSFHGARELRQDAAAKQAEDHELASRLRTSQMLEDRVHYARQTYGESLPGDFLSPEEYRLYVRLYGEPLAQTSPEDAELLEPFKEEEENGQNILLRENQEGELEEVEYELASEDGRFDDVDGETASLDDAKLMEELEAKIREGRKALAAQGYKDVDSDLPELQDQVSISSAASQKQDPQSLGEYEDPDYEPGESIAEDIADHIPRYEVEAGDDHAFREHPLTSAGKFQPMPKTVYLPYDTFVGPTEVLLENNAKLPHLQETAEKIFGGVGLPNTNATRKMPRTHLQQQPIALEAFQPKMSPIEANLFVATIMPGAYATAMATLVEVRKRLGSAWMEELLIRPGGPRILDAGAGGAAVLAWRDILRAEMAARNGEENKHQSTLPGKATVIAGSSELEHRASLFLDNTTFLPRLPDFERRRDMPLPNEGAAPTRKQYDVIVAPYSLWTLQEDHVRKAQIQNLWSLLDPNGGVLIVIEKGVPRGFELVAGAREVLLKHHIANSHIHGQEQMQHDDSNNHTQLEDGMIIAPCTNHNQCPMYKISGEVKGRKDYCHFDQRYIRPAYLQRILGAKAVNYEDIAFSYVAVQRGRDLRKVDSFAQNEAATDAALAGFEDFNPVDGIARSMGPMEADEPENLGTKVHMLKMPRIVLPPLKRTGHVTFDVCTPHGTYERWTTTRSQSRQAYRDARKAKWGDLWALGAKTRVVKEVRAGTQRNKKVIEIGIGATPGEDRIVERRGGKRGGKGDREGRAQKRTKKGRKPREEKVLDKKDLERLELRGKGRASGKTGKAGTPLSDLEKLEREIDEAQA